MMLLSDEPSISHTFDKNSDEEQVSIRALTMYTYEVDGEHQRELGAAMERAMHDGDHHQLAIPSITVHFSPLRQPQAEAAITGGEKGNACSFGEIS